MTDFTASRTAMVDCQVRPSDVTKYPIIAAMLDIPREVYVPTDLRAVAYVGAHVNLGGGRVVLDPRIFAKMLDALDVQPSELVLNVACSLGYGTAVLARLADFIVGLEENPDMAQEAQANLSAQSVDNAVVETGPLAEGAAKHGPYDVIVVEGGVQTTQMALLDQLKEGGRIAAIVYDDAAGQCRIGVKIDGKVSWRASFDANAPVLPGFEKLEAFTI